MSDNTSKNKDRRASGFAAQAAILAGAGIVSRIIGVLYRSPLFHIIGDEGNGYYGSAYAIYAMILMVSTYSIPTAVSKIISGKLAMKEYKSARQVFKCALVYVAVVGAIAAGLTYIFAPVLVKEQPNALPCMRLFAPTIFLAGFLGVYRGYLQAYNTMVPTSISQIIEQLVNAVVSVVAAYFFSLPFTKGTTEYAMHGAQGSALGTGMGVVAGLIFILIAYGSRRKEIMKTVDMDTKHEAEPYSILLKQIFFIVTPIIIASFVYNITTTVDMKIFYGILGTKNVDTVYSANMYGIFSGQYTVLINLPVSIASAVGTALIPSISAEYTKGDKKSAEKVFNQSLSMTMIVTIPCAVGMAVLSEPVVQLLFRGATKTASNALAVGAIAVVFYAMSTVTNSVLQGIGKVMAPVINSAFALVIHIIILVPILFATELNIYALVIGTVVYSFIMCVLNGISVKKSIGATMDVKKIFVAPAIASLFMGIAAWGSYQLIYRIVHINSVSLIIAVIIAIVFYFMCILGLGVYKEEDLLRLPKGNLVVKLAKKLHMLRD